MRKLQQLFFCGLFSLLTQSLCAQSANTSVTTTDTSFYGTYQLQVIDSRNQPYIPGNIKQMVLENRPVDQVKYISLGPEVRLMILPLSEIKKPGFQPIKQVGHVSSNSQ
jgi:hypothetical protein